MLGPLCHHLNWLQIWPSDGATCIDYKLSHQVALVASVVILTTSWCHLHQLKIGPPCATTCICSKFGHKVVPLALHQPESISCITCINCITSITCISSLTCISCIAWITWITYINKVTQFQRLGPIERTPGIPGSDKKCLKQGEKKLKLSQKKVQIMFQKSVKIVVERRV